MRTLLALFCLSAAISVRCQTTDLPISPSGFSWVKTNQFFSSNLVASTTFTNTQGCQKSVWHAFQFTYIVLGTNTTTLNIDQTLDTVNWYPVLTNTFGGSSNLIYQFIGKADQTRFRVAAQTTNATIKGNYLAQ